MKWSDQTRQQKIVFWAVQEIWSKSTLTVGQHVLTNVEENTTVYLVISEEDLKFTKDEIAQNILGVK